MQRRIRKFLPLMALLLAFALIAAACGDGDEGGDTGDTTAATTDGGTTETTAGGTTETTEPMAMGPVVVCELAYYTGEFAA